MSKILILANHSGGLYDFRNELPVRLLRAGHEVVISVPDDTKTALLEEEGCRLMHTDLDRRGVNPKRDLKLLGDYRQLLKEEKPDLVLTYTIKPDIYGGYLCGRLGIPYIVTITGLGSTFEKGGPLLKLIIQMYRAGLRKADCVVFQNAQNRDIFRGHKITGKKDRLVSGSGVDLEAHQAAAYPGHEGPQTRFLYAGRIMQEKGIDELLIAAKRLHEKYGDSVLVTTIGFSDENYDDKLKTAREEGYLNPLPFTKNIVPYMEEADAIVLPSWHEGMNNVLMEASATGRPCLCTNVSGCREIVDDQITGYTFEARNADALYEAMDRFMQTDPEKRAQMSSAARAKMEQEFDRHKVISAYLEEIEEILQK